MSEVRSRCVLEDFATSVKDDVSREEKLSTTAYLWFTLDASTKVYMRVNEEDSQ